MNASKLLCVSITVLCSHLLQSAENSLTAEQVSQLWSNAHNEKIKYFNDMNNFDTKPYFLRNAVLDNDETLVDDLLSNGTDITVADNQNATPWFYAVAKNNKNIMKLFLERGASLDIKDVHGLTPLHFAVKKDDTDSVKLFKNYLPTDAKNCKDDKGRTVLFYVTTPEMFELLNSMDLLSDINIQDMYGITPLHNAVRNHNSKIVDVLLQHDADITIKDDDRFTAWYDAVDNLSMINFSVDIKENDREIIKLFLNYEVNLKIRNTNGFTVLHEAVINNDVNLVNILKDYVPADAKNWKDYKGRTVLFYVTTPEMFELLKSMDLLSDINIQDLVGKTALHCAVIADNTRMIEMLIAHGADVNLPDKKQHTPLLYALAKNDKQIIKLFLDNSVDIQIPDKDGQTILHFAVKKNDQDLLNLLLDYDINFYAKDNQGKTAYHLAVQSGNLEILKEILDGGYYSFEDERLVDNYGRTPVYYVKNLDIVEYLKDLGAISNINEMRDKQGLTPLHYIVRQCASCELVQFFIEYLDADVTIKDGHGLTAYDYALDEGIKNLLEVTFKDESWELL